MGTGRLRMLIGAPLAVAAVVAIAALGGTAGDDQTQVYANRQLQIMAAAAPGGGGDPAARAARVPPRDPGLDDGIVGAPGAWVARGGVPRCTSFVAGHDAQPPRILHENG